MNEKVPHGWEKVAFDKFVSNMADGGTPSTSKEEYFGGPIAWIVIDDIQRKIFKTTSTLSELGLKKSSAKLWKTGTVILSTGATIGRVGICQVPAATKQGVIGIECNKDTDNIYLYYLLLNSQLTLNKYSQGSTIREIRIPTLSKLTFLKPPLDEQVKIAKILTSVDELIENISLEIEKVAFLKRAAMNDLLIKGGVDKQSKKSEIGDIPNDWDVKTLADICQMSRGKFSHRPRNDPRLFNGDIPFIQTGDVPKEEFEIMGYSQTLNFDGLKVSKLFRKGTLVMTIAANIGEVGILNFDSCFPDSLIGIEVNSNIDPMFLLLSLKQHKKRLEEVAPKNAQSNLNLEILSTFKLPIPEIETQLNISKTILKIEKHRLLLNKLRESYSDLKKSLMQDLLTGKVRVRLN